ncbi:MAG: PP2C family protein-serine/threonine phosphatase [Thermodesulfobacteriota bacterium]
MHKSTINILIIDDEQINAKMLQAILRRAGYQASWAQDGSQAREMARELQPDLILLDIMMPEESGFQVCSSLKKDPNTADIPIIFISALHDVQSKVQGFELGGVDYISKPFQKEEVLARVKTHLQLRHSYREVIQSQAERLKQVQKAQQSYLVRPQDEPRAGFEVEYIPVLEAGGDFYDVFCISPDLWGYFVADVSGHDLGSSLATSALKVLIRQNSSPIYSPQETMRLINQVLLEFFTAGRFLTACYACLNRDQQELFVISAGHPPLLYQGKDQEPFFLQNPGDVLGVFANAEFGWQKVKVQPGDRFFIYSDGLLEAWGKSKRDLGQGQKELKQAVQETKGLVLHNSVQTTVQKLLGSSIQPQDDVLLLGVEV